MSGQNDLSRRTHELKQQLYSKSNITFVAVSNWLAQKCKNSSLMRNAKIAVIPNAFPIEQFPFLPREATDWGVEKGKKVLIMGAARLDDEVKGFDKLIDMCRYLADYKPDVAAKCHLVLFGGIRNKALLEQIAIPYTYLGSVEGKQVPQLYAKSDVVLSTSYYETLPGTLVEGLASGCVGVSFASGGQSDIIDHLETGYLAESGNVADFVRGVEWAVNESAATRMLLNRIAEKRFSAEVVAQKYIALFEKELMLR
jgi:glycosyltransferase involved in cell wall biosynthesis